MMKAIRTWAVLVGSCLAVACAGGMGQETGTDSFTAADWSRFRTIRLHEQDFRSLAAVRPRPAYPEQSIEQGVSGVAVAAVLTTCRSMSARAVRSFPHGPSLRYSSRISWQMPFACSRSPSLTASSRL